MSTWGTDIMMLGKLGTAGLGHVGGGNQMQPRSGMAGAVVIPQMLGGIADDVKAVDWPYVLGSYAGSWAGGAGVGYIVGRKGKDAFTGGVAASGIWGIGEAVSNFKVRPAWLSGLFLVLGGGSLYFAWARR